MAKTRKSSPLSSKEAKCLACVKECELGGLDPSALAVGYILHGDASVNHLGYFHTYGCLTSISMKKIKTMVTLLLKKKYLAAYSPFQQSERYLVLTEEGEAVAEATLSKPFRKKPSLPTPPLFNERN